MLFPLVSNDCLYRRLREISSFDHSLEQSFSCTREWRQKEYVHDLIKFPLFANVLCLWNKSEAAQYPLFANVLCLWNKSEAAQYPSFEHQCTLCSLLPKVLILDACLAFRSVHSISPSYAFVHRLDPNAIFGWWDATYNLCGSDVKRVE